MTMTLHSSLPLLLLLRLLLTAAVTADNPLLATFGLRRDSETPRKDPLLPLNAAGQEREASAERVMQQLVRGVFTTSLWAALPGWPSGNQVAPNTDQDNYSYRQEKGRSLLAPVFHFYMPDTTRTNVSWACKADVEAFYTELSHSTEWAVKMVDAWGKFPDGLLVGNTWATGLLDECLELSVDQEVPQAHFKGRYCAMTFKEAEGQDREATLPNPSVRIAGVVGSLGLVTPDNVYATCIPSTCTSEEYKKSLEAHLEERGLELNDLACQTDERPSMQYSTGDVIMIVTLSLLGILVLVGTCGDLWTIHTGRPHQDTGPLRYFLVFSFYTNLKKMFHINVKESEEVISCLHGIRVLTMAWVVHGHTYLMSIDPSANKLPMQKAISNNPYPYQIIINGLVSVDTFFFMSGLLVAYNLTKEFNRTKRFNIPVYYIHRYLRLAPSILLLCGVFAVFPPLLLQGTFSPSMTEPGNVVDLCRRYWWRDSFFVTNWFFNEVDTESCVPVCWYTSVEFQLYIVTPFMFLPLLYRRKPGAVWLAFLLVASAVIPGIVIAVNELPPTQVMNVPYSKYYDYTKWVYTKPYCRASPYLVGLVLGYILRVVDKEKLHLTWWQAALGWVAAVATMCAVIFGITDYNTLSGEMHEYVPAVSILYGGLHRLAWGVALAWLVFACHMGYGGPANSLLAHPFWQPLSRLTYTIFLIALNMQMFYYLYMLTIPIYFSNFNKVLETAGTLLVSGCGAVLLSLLAESPVLGLEKLILKRESLGLRRKESHKGQEEEETKEEMEDDVEKKGEEDEEEHSHHSRSS